MHMLSSGTSESIAASNLYFVPIYATWLTSLRFSEPGQYLRISRGESPRLAGAVLGYQPSKILQFLLQDF